MRVYKEQEWLAGRGNVRGCQTREKESDKKQGTKRMGRDREEQEEEGEEASVYV